MSPGPTKNSRTNYQSLLQKKMQSELASNLEKRQQGEQFRILDPANLPGRAEGRMRVIGLGWALGFALGCGLIALRVILIRCYTKRTILRWRRTYR